MPSGQQLAASSSTAVTAVGEVTVTAIDLTAWDSAVVSLVAAVLAIVAVIFSVVAVLPIQIAVLNGADRGGIHIASAVCRCG